MYEEKIVWPSVNFFLGVDSFIERSFAFPIPDFHSEAKEVQCNRKVVWVSVLLLVGNVQEMKRRVDEIQP